MLKIDNIKNKIDHLSFLYQPDKFIETITYIDEIVKIINPSFKPDINSTGHWEIIKEYDKTNILTEKIHKFFDTGYIYYLVYIENNKKVFSMELTDIYNIEFFLPKYDKNITYFNLYDGRKRPFICFRNISIKNVNINDIKSCSLMHESTKIIFETIDNTALQLYNLKNNDSIIIPFSPTLTNYFYPLGMDWSKYIVNIEFYDEKVRNGIEFSVEYSNEPLIWSKFHKIAYSYSYDYYGYVINKSNLLIIKKDIQTYEFINENFNKETIFAISLKCDVNNVKTFIKIDNNWQQVNIIESGGWIYTQPHINVQSVRFIFNIEHLDDQIGALLFISENVYRYHANYINKI